MVHILGHILYIYILQPGGWTFALASPTCQSLTNCYLLFSASAVSGHNHGFPSIRQRGDGISVISEKGPTCGKIMNQPAKRRLQC